MRKLTVHVLVLAAVALAACPRSKPEEKRIVIGFPSSAVTLDPHFHFDEYTSSTLSHFFNKLVVFGPEMEVIPDLALSWENPSDTMWRFQLRSGVHFHDGRPFEAEDAAASIRRAIHLPGSRISYQLQAVSEARATGKTTLEIKTRYPTAVLLNKLVFIDILPREFEKVPVISPIGTGPYSFAGGKPGDPIRGKRFDGFWGPRPSFAEVEVISIPDEKERIASVSEKKTDVAGAITEAYLEWGKTLPNLTLTVREGLSVSMMGFRMMPKSPFSDVRVRKAIALAIDRKKLVFRNPNTLTIPMSQLVPQGIFGYRKDFQEPPQNLDAARELLKASGKAEGVKLPLLLADTGKSMAAALGEQLAPLGIQIEPEVLDWSRFYERFTTGEFSVALFNWTAATGDASDILDAVFHTAKDGYGASNTLLYSNPKLDQIVEASNRILDPFIRLQHIEGALQMLAEDVPAIPLAMRTNVYAVRPGLEWTPRRDRRIRAFDFHPARPK